MKNFRKSAKTEFNPRALPALTYAILIIGGLMAWMHLVNGKFNIFLLIALVVLALLLIDIWHGLTRRKFPSGDIDG